MRLCVGAHFAPACQPTPATARCRGCGPFTDQGITMRLPTFRITGGFLPANLAVCSARAQHAAGDVPARSSPLRNAWRRVVAAGRFVHLPLPASWMAPTKS